jgi:tubulin polyglutamylase TTLL6/13
LSSDIKKRVLDEDKRRVKDRLLNKVKPNPQLKDELTNCSATTAMEKSLAWTQQMSWEESHLGSYRRICPPPGDPNKYSPFFVLQSQASVYSETASSKRREEHAKKQRCELEEKNRYSNSFLNGHVVARTHIRPPRLFGEDDEKPWTMKKQRWGVVAVRDQYEEVPIDENQERERLSLLAQRDFLIRSTALLQAVSTVNLIQFSILI